jgi:hypothetical protein
MPTERTPFARQSPPKGELASRLRACGANVSTDDCRYQVGLPPLEGKVGGGPNDHVPTLLALSKPSTKGSCAVAVADRTAAAAKPSQSCLFMVRRGRGKTRVLAIALRL